MKKLMLLFSIIFFFFLNTKAQNTFLRTYGGVGYESLEGSTQTSDGSFYLSGSSASFTGNTIHGYLVKTDELGQLLWAKNTNGTISERFFDAAPTSDNGVVVVGAYHQTTDGQALVSRFDSLGNVLWTTLLGATGLDAFTTITATDSGDFLVTGYTKSYNPGGGQDAATAKIDGNGTLIWYRSFGGYQDELGAQLLETQTINGHIFAGNTQSYGSGGWDGMICQITANGGLAGTKIIGSSIDEKIINMKVLPNGDGVYAGFATFGNTSRVWVFRYSATNNLTWCKTYGLSNINLKGVLDVASDGNLLVVATHHLGSSGQFLLLKINATTGNIIWVKEYDSLGNETVKGLGRANNGMIYMMGHSDSYQGAGSSDYFTLTAHTDGSLDSCSFLDITTSINALDYQPTIMNVVPSNMTNVTSSTLSMPIANAPTSQYNICYIEQVTANFGLSNDTICAGDCIQLIDSSINANAWKWTISGANISTSTLQNPNNICFENGGNYTIQLRVNNNTTMDTLTKIVHVLPAPPLDLGNDLSFCDSANYLIDATTTDAIYQWQDNSTLSTFNAISTGNYAVTLTNSVGCSISDTLGIRFENTPIISLGNDTIICEHQFIMLNATTLNATYLWSNNSTNPILWVENPNLYHVEVTLGACVVSDSIQVDIIPTPLIFLGEDQFICDDETIILDVFDVNASSYLWQDSSSNSDYIISEPGTYHAFVSYNSGCFNSDTITLLPEPSIYPTLPTDTVFCKNTPLILEAYQENILRYQWEGFSAFYGQNNLDSSSFIVTKGGTYSVIVSNECRNLTQVIQITQEDCGCYPFVPNAFTPNNDGYNDRFKIYHNCLITNFKLKIFNRWGENIFQSEDLNTSWNGTNNGQLVPAGVYVWMMEYETVGVDGQLEKRLDKGEIVLIR